MKLLIKQISVLFITIILSISVSAQTDTTENKKFGIKKIFGMFSGKKDTTKSAEPEKIELKKPKLSTGVEWLKMSKEEQEEETRLWHEYDSAKYTKGYNLSEAEKKVLRKRRTTLSASERVTYNKIKRKKEKFDKNMFDAKMKRSSKLVQRKISGEEWLTLTVEEQTKLLKEWEEHDSTLLREKYKHTQEEQALFLKRPDEMSFFERRKLLKASKKPVKFRKEMLKNRIARLDQIVKFYKNHKIDTSGFHGMEIRERHKIVSEDYKVKNVGRAIEKQKIMLEYDEEERLLREEYQLSIEEKIVMNKGQGKTLRGKEKTIYRRTQKRQLKFSTELQALRKERHYALQDKKTRKRMKENIKNKEKREKARQKNKKKKRKK